VDLPVDLTQWFTSLSGALPTLGLVVLRSSGLFFTAPLFGQDRVPVMVRVFFSIAIASLIFPSLNLNGMAVPTDTLNWLIAGVLELLTGAIYGWSSLLMFEGMILAGQMVGLQMGFAQANVLNPESQTQRPLLSEIYYLLAFMVFFAINGHHMLILIFQKSFSIVPLGQLAIQDQLMAQLSLMVAQIFIVGLMLAAPINGILTLIDIILGLIARTAPQMNMLLLSFSIKIYIGLLSFFFALSFTVEFLKDLLPDLLQQVMQLF